MSTVVVAATAIIASLVGASAIGVAVNRRSGVLRETGLEDGSGTQQDTSDIGLSSTGPTVVRFTAEWCGPCASVRRVVDQVCAVLPDVAHVEINIDANPAAAKRFSVLSLPTTFIFDVDGRQRYRTAGVPKVADLKTALQPLLG